MIGHRGSSAWPALFVAGFISLCLLLTRPFVEMGVIDDWSYIKTAQIFANTGHFVYNNWATAMLGWQVPLSAAAIKLFGFSFTAARLYMFPVTAVAAYLCCRVLQRFDISPANAVFGTMLVFLSPICLPLEFTSMTDIPGLLVVLVCVWMCQQSARSLTDGRAVAWLCAAAATNVAGGTVRQVAWLGVLVMVPSTAYWLRRRRGMLPAGAILFATGLFCVLAMVHWLGRQPHVVAEQPLLPQLRPYALLHLAAQLLRALFCLLFLLLPLSLASLPRLRHSRKALLGTSLVFVIATGVFAALPHLGQHGRPATWLFPFMPHVLESLGADQSALADMLGDRVVLPTWARIAVSVLTLTAGFALFRDLMTRRAGKRLQLDAAIFWILGPFLLANILLLTPRGLTAMLFDRYLIPILLIAVIMLLKIQPGDGAARVTGISIAMLAFFSLVTLAATHDFYSLYRARVAAGEQLIAAGVPPTEFEGGFDYDGWTQLQAGQYIFDDSNPNNPASGFVDLKLPEECSDWAAGGTPLVKPRYFILRSQVRCFQPAGFADVPYRNWLPPFHRALLIEKLRPGSSGAGP